MRRAMFVALACGMAAGMASAQSRTLSDCWLMVPESSNDRVMLFNSTDGSLITDNWIDLSGVGAGTPINSIMVGDEIWISDQIADSVFRYSMDGSTHLGTISGQMDNIRGMEWLGDTVYVTNSGTGNGAAGDGLVTINVNTNSVTGHFATGDAGTGDPFDALAYFGNLVVNDISGEDIDIHATDGTFLSEFHNSDGVNGIDFPEQMTLTQSGTILAGGFSSPAGIYEYDSDGNQIAYYDVGTGVRGVHELANGNIMFTDGDGVHVLDPNTGLVTDSITGVSARFIECVIPSPGTLGLVGLGGLLAARRRR